MAYADPIKQRESQYRWYIKNKDQAHATSKKSKEKIKDVVRQLKAKPCTDCSKTYPWYVMDFDHQSDKFMGISIMTKRYGIERIMEEIAKCELVCSNCHRERTYQRSIQQ